MNYDYLQLLKKLGVKVATAGMDGKIIHVEFFPEAASDDIEKKAEAKDDEVNPATGLTKAQSRDLLGMDE